MIKTETLDKEQQHTIVIFGLGSIGLRLARLIKEHFGYKIVAFRSVKGKENELGIQEIFNLHEIEKLSPDIAFITNPTSFHMETAILAASMGMALFIEKPLSHRLDHWDSLIKILNERGLRSFIGCNLRFDPMLLYLKKIIEIQKVYYSRVICSSFLPSWRPHLDYRKSYSARKDQGGGVLLDLIHEPDYCHWLFGNIMYIEGCAGKRSWLEIETEDFAEMTLHHRSGILSHIYLDYFGMKTERKVEIFGEGFHLDVDLISRRITTFLEEGENVKIFHPLHRDDTYKEELNYFFTSLQHNEIPMNSIEEHMMVLKPLLEFKNKIGW